MTDLRIELEHVAHELELAENALLCASFHNSAVRAKAAARRAQAALAQPKPPSLKQQALKAVNEMSDCMSAGFVPKRSDLDTIRRALEALPND